MPTRNLTGYKRTISEQERKEIIEYSQVQSPSVRLAVLLMDGLGLRVSEAVALREQDLDFERGVVLINATKQNKIIERIMSDKLMKQLKKHIKTYKTPIKKCKGYLCFSWGHGGTRGHISKNNLGWFFVFFRKEYGYLTPYTITSSGKPLYRHSCHTLRSNWITRFVQACNATNRSAEAPRLAQLEIGHVKIETTMGYIRFHDRQEQTLEVVNIMN